MKKFIKIGEYILFILFLVLVPFFKSKLYTFLIIPLLILLFFVNKKIKTKYFPILLFLIAFIIRIIGVFVLKLEVVDDFKTMLEASRNLINGNLDFLSSNYFLNFPYQLGHVLYQALFLKIINSVLFLKIINSIITSSIIIFIYFISKKIVKEETARYISILYLFYFYPLYLNSVLTNQHLPVLLSLIGIYLLLEKPKTWKLSIIISFLLALANVFRTESIIWIAGIVLYKILIEKDKVVNTLVLLGTYLLFTTILSNLVYLSPLHTKLVNNDPEWKFYCGLSTKYNGIYNAEDEEVFFHSEKGKELLIQRIKQDKTSFPVLFLKKEVILWTQTNYDLILENKIDNSFLNLNQGYLNIIILLFIIGIFPRKEEKKEILLFKIILALYYGIYLFIEISPRYAYVLHILMFILIGVGIEKTKEIFNNKIRWDR